MSQFRPYSPQVTLPPFPYYLNSETSPIHTPSPGTPFNPPSSPYLHSPSKQSVRTTIRPSLTPPTTIQQQLTKLINRPAPVIFQQNKRLGLAYHKITYSRSKSKSGREGEGRRQEERRRGNSVEGKVLLQEISEKLNTVSVGRREQQKEKGGKGRAALKKGEMNPGTKMVFQRQPSIRVVEYDQGDKHNDRCNDKKQITIDNKEINKNMNDMKVDKRQDVLDIIDKDLKEVIKKQEVKSSRIQIIDNYVPLYIEFFSIKDSTQDTKNEIVEEKQEIKHIGETNNIEDQYYEKKVQYCHEQNNISEFLSQPPTEQKLPQQQKTVKSEAQLETSQSIKEIVLPQLEAKDQQQQLVKDEISQLQQQQEYVEINFYDQLDSYHQQQEELQLLDQQQKPKEEQFIQTYITPKQTSQTIEIIAGNNEEISNNHRQPEQTLSVKQQLLPQSQQQPLIQTTSSNQIPPLQQSIINHLNLEESQQTIKQETKIEQNTNFEVVQEPKQQQRELTNEQSYALLEKFIKQNQEKINNNLLLVNTRREMQKDLDAFWKEQDEQEQQEEGEQEELGESDTKTVELPITQQDVEHQQSTSQQLSPTNKLQLSDFIKGKRLGKGMFGQVFLVRHILTGFTCALKVLSKPFIRSQKMTEQLFQQLKIHSSLSHPNIVQIYGYFSDTDNIYVLQELCTGGQLYDLIVKRRRISQKRAAYYMRQLAQGLRYLQTVNIVHRDIKPENILIQEGVVKICDFGWAMWNVENVYYEKCGTPLYMSPEVVKGDVYSDKVDVWGLGLITYELVIGNIPWNIWTEEETTKIVTDELTFPTYVMISKKTEEFIRKALSKNPQERISLLEAFVDEFLIEVNPMVYQNEGNQAYGEVTP